MDNLYFGLTKPELIERVAGGDQGAQAELDRRAAKKAAKQTVARETAAPQTLDEQLDEIRRLIARLPIEDLVKLSMTEDFNNSVDEVLAGLPIS